MKHYNEDDLILYHYRESGADAEVERHLAGCERCRSAYGAIRSTLDAVDPEDVPARSEAYSREVWARLQHRIEDAKAPGWRAWLGPRRLVPVAAAAALVVFAFLAGQWRGREEALESMAGPIPGEVRERILLVAVDRHLEQSRRLLIELVHAEGNGEVDMTGHRERARALAVSNRLYRRSSAAGGDLAAAGVLDQLERILLDVSNGPATLPASDLERLQERIGRQGILLRIRMLGDRTTDRRQESRPSPSPGEV